ncbi:uracil phosphoribosyltransferase [Thermosyntropha lipolytica DSM 11003]|uniref:Uracil phosphoribosyltransferase n=1 Tax=Thermosyntropha lipolytica DSM 11003 TaxID=1123382 RepID=A0A1M5MVW6_9FIRM|nr:uracil phosphoribosyltransferase [Thermosyntropha lipolytica]SHG81431.1 uracil phosphoribosyltransferase [Thermosyntropha lipolytica DSM 11003]
MEHVTVLNNPIAGNCIKALRDKETKTSDFRRALRTLGYLLAVEACQKLKTKEDKVITPLEVEAVCSYVDDSRILLVPVLRAGLGLVESFLTFLPSARVAHVGMYRDHETLEAKPYLNNVPPNKGGIDQVIVLDPMLATGNSGVKALEFVVEKGYKPEQIIYVCAFAAEPGIKQVLNKFPGVEIITAVIDPILNDKGYIVPGLGDAGDRLYLY